jgi:hypothetical protein
MNTKVRVKKREVVIPFEGEEMFIVPKRGGFGQPDMEGYVMASGRNTGLETDTSNPTLDTTTGGTSTTFQTGNTGIGVATGGSADIPPPSGTTSTSTSSDGAGTLGGGGATSSGTNAGDVPTGNQSSGASTTLTEASTRPETGINSPIQTGSGSGGQIVGGVTGAGQQTDTNVGAGSNTGGGANTNTGGGASTDVEIPLFPDLSNMNCTELKSEITRLSSKIATTVFPIIVANAYNNQITLAKSIDATKCTRSTTNEPLILIPSTDAIIGGGGFGGGGGGGFGEPPMDEVAPTVEEEKSNMGLFLIIGGVALIYFLTKKNKQ